MYPILFHFGSTKIYAYGFLIGLGFVAGLILSTLYALHPTQLYEAAGSLALFFFLNWKLKNKSFDGQILWLFLLLYSVFRFFVEMLRDDPRGFVFQGLLSASQAIGILLAILSLFMLFYLNRHKIRTGRL